MSYRRTFLLPVIFMMVFILYLSDNMVAMAVSQPEAVTEPEPAVSVSDNHVVPIPGSETPSEPEGETPPVPEGETPPVPESETPPVPEGETPPVPEGETSSVPEGETPSALESEIPSTSESEAEVFYAAPAMELQEDCVSTGGELMAWMEEHKNTGGSVRLLNHVSMDQSYVFVPTNLQPTGQLIVDTAGYTITVTSEIELWSGGRLTFIGNANDKGILHVAEGGMLDMHSVIVEDRQTEGEQPSEAAFRYALWQEEGAGLAIDNCQVSGDVRYAQTFFVMYDNFVYAIAETGQTADDVLPAQIACEVNYQGAVSNRQMPVSWDLEGTQKQQEERTRFVIQGSFINAASVRQPVCTMIYNDYPLTFTDVKASEGNGFYFFKGGYTRPEEYVPMEIATEYSFDGDNWFVDEKRTVSMAAEPATFVIGFQDMSGSTEEHSYVYIRLRGEYNGSCYLSNILRYSTDSLAVTEEIGGGRGGGTSVVNPPDIPENDSVDVTSKQSEVNEEGNTGINLNGDDSSGQDTGSHAEGTSDSGTDAVSSDTKPSAQTHPDVKESETNSSRQTSSDDTSSAKSLPDAEVSDKEPAEAEQAAISDIQPVENTAKSTDSIKSVQSDGHPEDTTAKEREDHAESLQKVPASFGNVALTFVAVSLCGGAAGFGIYAGIFRRAFHAFRRAWYK